MIRIYTGIVGDLFHIGHLNHFKQIKGLFAGASIKLIAGVHSDKDVETYKRTPFIIQEHRYEIIRSCRYVDEVIEAAPLAVTESLLTKYNIDFVAHGDDITTDIYHEVPIEKGIMIYVPYTKNISTTEIASKYRKWSHGKL